MSRTPNDYSANLYHFLSPQERYLLRELKDTLPKRMKQEKDVVRSK